MAHWPATPTSRVVLVRHEGVWAGDQPDPAIVLQMLDAGLGTLTDQADVLAVWRALFDAGERVLLKVNCISSGGPTQPAVTTAVTQRLQDAGLAPGFLIGGIPTNFGVSASFGESQYFAREHPDF